MLLFNLFSVKTLAIINETAKTLAVINDNKSASNNLNYIIGGLLVIIIVLVGSTLFGKK